MSVEGWKKVRISEFGVIVTGSTPDTKNSSYWDGDIPFVSPADFNSSTFVVKTYKNLTDEGAKRARIVPKNSILVTCIGSIGGISIAPWDCVTNQQINSIICSDDFDNIFVYLLIQNNLHRLVELAGITTLPIINKRTFGDIELFCPNSVSEQTQIATILSTIDRAIEQTEALIAKQQRIKTGLMQDLLTKGIDENGNIRSEETHEFKDSPLGRIPVEWEVSQLRDTGTWLSGGTPSKSEKTYWGPFVPWVCSKDMKVFDLKNTLEMITQKGVLSGSKVAPKDSVLIVVRGMILAHTFPVVYLTRDMAFNQDIKAIIPNENIYGRYLAYWFSANSSQLLKLTTTATHGTKRLETNDLLEFALCLPSKMEQKKIIYLLDKSQYDIEITKEYLQKLKLQKTGLMQDLLTGKVRVTDLLNQKTATN